MATRKMVRLNFDVTPEFNCILEALSEKLGETKAGVVRKAIALLEFAVEAKEQGLTVASVKGGKIITVVVGV